MKIQNIRDSASRAITKFFDNWTDTSLHLLLLKSSMGYDYCAPTVEIIDAIQKYHSHKNGGNFYSKISF